MLLRLLSSAMAALLLAGCTTPASVPVAQPGIERGVVSAADPRAAEAGATILRQGGSATDAAIAVMLALTVVEPQSSGIGGGGFFVHADPEGTLVTLDGRETAPAVAQPDWFLAEDGNPLGFREAVLSGLSVGVPGNVALAAEAHSEFGRLPWAEIFAPAIALARDGFVITPRFHNYLARSPERAGQTEAGRSLYYGPDGEPLPAGTLVRNEALAQTLEDIAANGRESFYSGEFAEQLARAVADYTPSDDTMREEDIAAYSPHWRDAVCGDYREYRICSMGPPSSGATTVIAMLMQLERFDLSALGAESPVFWHLFAESQRLAYADRELYLADSDFVDVPVEWLTDRTYLDSRSALISADSRMAQVAAGRPAPTAFCQDCRADGDEPEEQGTSHFAVIDNNGNVVSYTSTIEGAFGSGLVFGGFYLNNELTDFSLSPEIDGVAVANRVEGGKRPRSSMSPTIVFGPEGEVVMAIGAAGGSTIPVQVTKALIGVIDFDLTAQEAIALPLVYSPGDTVVIEEGSSLADIVPELEALGHTVIARGLPLKANAVELRDGQWQGAADPRSEGTWVTQ